MVVNLRNLDKAECLVYQCGLAGRSEHVRGTGRIRKERRSGRASGEGEEGKATLGFDHVRRETCTANGKVGSLVRWLPRWETA